MKMRKINLWIISLLGLLITNVFSDAFFDATKLKAEQGDAEAQYNLGVMYDNGTGVLENKREAVKWYRKAADQGYVDAQFNLGGMYFSGEGVLEDKREAVKWHRKAAEQGDAGAQYNLGLMYFNGEGVLENKREAVKWWQKAANQRHAGAQYNLGLMYDNGTGVLKDKREAVKWYRKAAEKGHVEAQCNLGVMYKQGTGVLEDYVEAYAWYLVSVMNGSTQGTKNKVFLRKELTASQVDAGQRRAKELQAHIERNKAISNSDSKQPLSANITPSGFGSGLFIKGGYVLTCWHVVKGAERVSVSIGGKDYVANMVQKDEANDIAILKISGVTGGVALSLANTVKLGEKVFTLGYPHPSLQGSNVKFTTGSISSLTGVDNTPRYYQISAPLQSGNSGGPLFDEHGNLVGMVAAKLDSLVTLAMTGDMPQNVNYAIKVDYLKPLLKTVAGLEIKPEKMKSQNLLELIDELKKSAVMVKVY